VTLAKVTRLFSTVSGDVRGEENSGTTRVTARATDSM